MHIEIITVGRMKQGVDTEMLLRYLKRLEKSAPLLGINIQKISEIVESRHNSSDGRKKEEGERLLKLLCPDSFLVLLDEKGKNLNSVQFSQIIEQKRDSGLKHFVFAIGGPDGHGEEIRKRANFFLSFGQMTWPHQITRILLVEQLYRSMTILSNHPYHRQ